jgi:DtxR family transcriptional regulator, manganese transport regulator
MKRLASASLRATAAPAGLQRTREEHAQETAQDYVELIAELIATAGTARVTDLARCLGVTHVTVNRTIQRLRRDGLVTAEPYRAIFLTEAGRKLSEESRRRHEIVGEFLESLGVPAAIAHADAEGMEHHVSQETLAAFVKHLKNCGPARGADGPVKRQKSVRR